MLSKFISFEGGEGSGKSTQAQLLVGRLERAGLPARFTREPGGSPLAERIRTMLLDGVFRDAGPAAEAVLFAAARSDHLSRTILPALALGTTVVCDRFFDSTAVYQKIGGADPAFLEVLRAEATGGVAPDLTIILDVDVEVSATRAAKRRSAAAPDRFEAESMDFHRAVRTGFLEIAKRDTDRCAVIDASGSLEEISSRIDDELLRRFGWQLRSEEMSP